MYLRFLARCVLPLLAWLCWIWKWKEKDFCYVLQNFGASLLQIWVHTTDAQKHLSSMHYVTLNDTFDLIASINNDMSNRLMQLELKVDNMVSRLEKLESHNVRLTSAIMSNTMTQQGLLLSKSHSRGAQEANNLPTSKVSFLILTNHLLLVQIVATSGSPYLWFLNILWWLTIVIFIDHIHFIHFFLTCKSFMFLMCAYKMSLFDTEYQLQRFISTYLRVL